MNWPEEVLKKMGLRITQQRIQVLEYLARKSGPVNLTDLNQNFSDRINRITLYRILNDFEELGIIRLFFSHDGKKCIEWTGEHHETHDEHPSHLHFQCKTCDKIFCLDDIEIKNLPEGFNLSSDQSVLVGTCSVCD
jgi:Fur family transcriptional regulator, ferric uptake regulator